MDGHALQVGGAIVDSGNFDWTRYPDKFPGLCTPDESYHGVTYTERFGLGGAYITKATVQLMRDLGSIPSPQNCFLLNIGLETLPLRMGPSTAPTPRRWRSTWRSTPRWRGSTTPACRATSIMSAPGSTCPTAAAAWSPSGSREAGAQRRTFMAGLKLASIATHVADAKTCVLHPASSTHRQMNDEELAAAGVAPDLVRFSVGIEDVKDIIADLEQALAGV